MWLCRVTPDRRSCLLGPAPFSSPVWIGKLNGHSLVSVRHPVFQVVLGGGESTSSRHLKAFQLKHYKKGIPSPVLAARSAGGPFRDEAALWSADTFTGSGRSPDTYVQGLPPGQAHPQKPGPQHSWVPSHRRPGWAPGIRGGNACVRILVRTKRTTMTGTMMRIRIPRW